MFRILAAWIPLYFLVCVCFQESRGTQIGTVYYGGVKGVELSSTNNTGNVDHRMDIMDKPNSPTVHHFARHGLCSHTNGKVRFYKALGKHFQNISATMIIYFVLDLCERKDEMLDSWVKEIFDKDGDGFISHFEKDLIRD
ncbi:uncharacterized protein LOC128203738 [Mya arenaria]|uniref:uncharacterized protein LOC128203738 n=1 Tax=Mya arenaria TaxID=6604 RepID=UPI0022E4FAE0|nr:uncharacterized protein LOC128203738 [Mya arenaria]